MQFTAAGTHMSERVLELGLEQAWEILAAEPDAVLIDVRTEPEWQFVGLPDLSSLGKQPLLVPWVRYPGTPNEHFVDDVRQAGVHPDQPVLLLCRSGQRSRVAGAALVEAGYSRCVNITAGFEGPIDHDGHRSGGWRSHSLPWRQS